MTEHSFSQNRRHKTKHNSCNVLLGKEETQAQASHQVVFTDGHKIFEHDLKDTPLFWAFGFIHTLACGSSLSYADGHNISVQYLESSRMDRHFLLDSRLGSLGTKLLKHEIVFCGCFHADLLTISKCLLYFDFLKTCFHADLLNIFKCLLHFDFLKT